MRFIYLIVLLVLFALPAVAADRAPKPDRIRHYTNAVAVIQDKPCEVGLVLANTRPEVKAELRGGTITFNASDSGGRVGSRKLCWLEVDGEVYIIDEDLNGDVRPSVEFKEKPPAKGQKSI